MTESTPKPSRATEPATRAAAVAMAPSTPMGGRDSQAKDSQGSQDSQDTGQEFGAACGALPSGAAVRPYGGGGADGHGGANRLR
ncbi:MAG TPA: hypothetical protein VF069_19530 [Streptosporangiaceae bacterium]